MPSSNYQSMSQENKEHSLIQLPPRNKGTMSGKFKSIGITTNHYFVNSKVLKKIYIYRVRFTPMIPQDNTKLRKQLLNQKHSEIKEQIQNPIYSGMNIYSLNAPASSEKQYTCEEYNINIKQVKVYDLQVNPKLLLTFLNNALRNIMNKLDFVQIGRSAKYFNGKEKTTIDNLIMFNGFKANFVRLQKGYFLRVDSAKKIVRNQTVLQYMDDIYKIHKEKQKNEKRNLIKSQLIGKIVMSNYGKTQYYQIQDIEFIDISSVMIEEKMSLVQYYDQKYRLKIKNLKQPLLTSSLRRKDQKIYLVPQLMLMTGIPENFDEFRRKKISEQTIKDPDAKMKQIESLMQKIAYTKQMKTLQQIGISVNDKLQKIEGKQIPIPQLELGKKNIVEKGKQAFFNLFNKPIFSAKHDVPCKIIYPKNTDVSQFKEVFERTSKNLGVEILVQTVGINPSIPNIQSQVAKAIQKDFKICCIIIPTNMKNQYKDIKILTLKHKLVTQIVTESTMRKKNLQSIATKVLLQIIAKRGNILWVPRMTNVQMEFSAMLVAFDQTKLGNKTLLAICATINSTFSLVYTCTKTFEGNEDKFKAMEVLLLGALGAFNKRNKGVPDEIIIMQNSCPGDQIPLLHQLFVQPVVKSIEEIYTGCNVAITLALINVKTVERFFAVNGKVHNPPAGTLISQQVITDYDFYIVSQASQRGTAVPNHYKIVYSNSKIQQGMLHQIFFTQTFNYVNWTGSIKIPAVLQYAKKAAKFGAEVLGQKQVVPEELYTRLYYV